MLADALSLSSSSSGGLIHGLMFVLLVGICVLLIWWVGTWFIGRLGAPGIVRTVWDGLFILVGLVVIINFLMGLGGHAFITW
jgi:hypothetical protein